MSAKVSLPLAKRSAVTTLDEFAGGGAVARADRDEEGIITLTNRVLVEMVPKSASIGATVIASVSAPTALVTHPYRILFEAVASTKGW
jgi:FdhD/NarQ family